jgi:hypothetical protein
MNRIQRTCYAYLLLPLSLAIVAGCGPGGPKVVPVQGQVSLDGQPLAFKSLLFVPENGTEGNGAGGYTNGAGEYTLTAVVFGATRDFDGCPPGNYRVVVSEPSIPITEADFATPQAPEDSDEPVPALGPALTPVSRQVPAAYSSPDTTPLRIQVPDAGGQIDLTLVSNPG